MLDRSLSSPHVASKTLVCYRLCYKLHEDRLVFTCVPMTHKTVTYKLNTCLLKTAACLPALHILPLPWVSVKYILGSQ